MVEVEQSDGTVRIIRHGHGAGLEMADWLQKRLSTDPAIEALPDVVMVERFIISPRTLQYTRAGAMEAIYTIGMVQYICHRADIALRMSTAAVAKHGYPDARIRALGIGLPRNDHERDALRHALLATVVDGSM